MNIIHSKNGFNKLKDLLLSSPSIDIINSIINTTNVLQRLEINMTDNTFMNGQELENVLIRLINTQKSLEYIGINASINDWNEMIHLLIFSKL